MSINTNLSASNINDYQKTRASALRESLCHAPFQNLYFGRNGKVSSCCYNRKFVLGKFPEQTLEEIWKGPLLMDFRDQFQQAQLGDGCNLCAEQITAGNYNGLRAKTYDKFAATATQQLSQKIQSNKKEFWNKVFNAITSVQGRKKIGSWLRRIGKDWQSNKLNSTSKSTATSSSNFNSNYSYPRSMEFELSNLCNLECAMCFGDYSSSIRKNRDKLPPLPEFYNASFVEQLEPFIPHLWEAKFYGGEPFLIPLYYDIWEQFILLNQDALISITTNATIFNKKVERILDRLNVFIVLSIDSLEKSTYEQIRKNAKFERVKNHIDKFEAIGKQKGYPLSLSVCPMTLNKEEIPDLVAYCCEHGHYIYFNTVWFPYELSLRALPKKVLETTINNYENYQLNYIDPISKQNITVFRDLINQLKSWLDHIQDTPDTPQENFIL